MKKHRCPKCEEEKEMTEENWYFKDGKCRKGWCKECHRTHNRNRYRNEKVKSQKEGGLGVAIFNRSVNAIEVPTERICKFCDGIIYDIFQGQEELDQDIPFFRKWRRCHRDKCWHLNEKEHSEKVAGVMI